MAWLTRDLLLEIKQKKRSVCWAEARREEYSGAACCREQILVAKAQLALKLARTAGDNKKSF